MSKFIKNTENKIQEYINKPKLDILELIENLENSNNFTDVISELGQIKTIIEINNKTFKATNISLELIKFFYESLKMILLLDENQTETIIYQVTKITKNICNLADQSIIELEGLKKGKFKAITQKEITLLTSNYSIVKNMFIILLNSFSHLEMGVQEIKKSIDIIDNLSQKCLDKMQELFQQM
jgi:hypothetical protein